jgi:DNA-binding NtrC family response regulator
MLRKGGKNFRNIASRALSVLEEYQWPGNVRVLQNVIERGAILCRAES